MSTAHKTVTESLAVFGVKVSKNVQAVLDKLDRVEAVEIPSEQLVDLLDYDAADPAAEVERVAIMAASRQAASEARSELRRYWRDQALKADQAELTDDVVERLRPGFEEAVDAYRAAVQALPADLSDAGVLRVGVDALEAVQAAQDAWSKLERYVDLIQAAQRHPIGAVDGAYGYPDVVRSIWFPESLEAAEQFRREVARVRDPRSESIGKAGLVAIRLGVEFDLRHPDAIREHYAGLTSTVAERNQRLADQGFERPDFVDG